MVILIVALHKRSATNYINAPQLKIYKKFISEFPAAVAPKLRLGIVLNFGGPVSHEFAIFAKFFCIDLLNALH